MQHRLTETCLQKNQLDLCSRFDTIPACDTHTRTHTETDRQRYTTTADTKSIQSINFINEKRASWSL